MANHRMVSNRIANSAKFLQMPAEAQLLFFHMVLRADDDGIVESYPLMKLLGSAPDNFKILQAKGFIQQLNEDQVVVIMDWLEHNTIRADRKTDSIYLPILKERFPEIKTVIARPRIDVQDNSRRLDSPRTAQGKISKGKVITSAEESAQVPITEEKGDGEVVEQRPVTKKKYPHAKEIFALFPRPQAGWQIDTTQCQHAEVLFLKGLSNVKAAIDLYEENKEMEFIPKTRTPYELSTKWLALLDFKSEKGL